MCDRETQTDLAETFDQLFDASRGLRWEMREQELDLLALERAVLNQTFEPSEALVPA
jgi:hypothetical protein